jgi:alkyl sulfatase BDS1-like metallo-beta-lactamase superfamily hydrolase
MEELIMKSPIAHRIFLTICSAFLAVAVGTSAAVGADSPQPVQPKEATEATKSAQAELSKTLPFDNVEDFELSERGLIARPESVIIHNEAGRPVWDLDQYSFLKPDAESPDTVSPVLWRQARLNMSYGLYKVTDRIYQVRGYDLSNITFIEGDTGWIVIDPLISVECAKAALELVEKHLGKRPIVAVIYSHSHADHFGGVRGIISDEDVAEGRVKIIAPEGFMHYVISENILSGNAMSRRAVYMFGALLPRGPKGQVDAGLGKSISTGTISLIPPTDIISETGTEITIDGIEMVFQNTPGTEAPAEMNTYFPQFKALWMAENCTHTLHNVYTPRGASVRDSLAWAKYITEAIVLFGDKSDLVFASHHWPLWGQEKVIDFLEKQRDTYKYIHDQTLRLANHGNTIIEIAEMIELPESLKNEWHNRNYYGTINHNVKAVYQKYLGWYDGNPANLHPLPPERAGAKYVEFMGGPEAVIAKARKSFAGGEYRWVAQVMSHVVFAYPENQEARNLEADALEQLGYQAESGPWRNIYLVGAKELREGIRELPAPSTVSPDTLRAMTLDNLFDFLAVRVNGPKADGRKIALNLSFADTGDDYLLTLDNAVLNYLGNKKGSNVDASITLTRRSFAGILLGKVTLDDMIAAGAVKVDGKKEKFLELLSLLDSYEFWFDIVTP